MASFGGGGGAFKEQDQHGKEQHPKERREARLEASPPADDSDDSASELRKGAVAVEVASSSRDSEKASVDTDDDEEVSIDDGGEVQPTRDALQEGLLGLLGALWRRLIYRRVSVRPTVCVRHTFYTRPSRRRLSHRTNNNFTQSGNGLASANKSAPARDRCRG